MTYTLTSVMPDTCICWWQWHWPGLLWRQLLIVLWIPQSLSSQLQ